MSVIYKPSDKMEYVLYVQGLNGSWQEDCTSFNAREILPIKRYLEREGKTVVIRKRIVR